MLALKIPQFHYISCCPFCFLFLIRFNMLPKDTRVVLQIKPMTFALLKNLCHQDRAASA